jgi:O-antigen/teichoic acid export membrane protein
MINKTEITLSLGFRKLGINSAIYIVGDILTRGTIFLLIPVYTRHLSPAEYGNWSVLLSLISLVSIIFSLQLSSSLTINYFQISDDKRGELITTLLITTLFTSVIFFSIFTFAGIGRVDLFFKGVTKFNYILSMGVCFFAAMNTIPQALMRLRQNAMVSVVINSISYLLGVLMGVFLLTHLDLGVTGLLLGALVANLLSVLAHIFVVRNNLIPRFSLSIVYSSLAVSLPIIPHMLSHWGLNLMDRLVLQNYLPLSEVGVYQLGYQIGTAFQIIVIAINSAWTPYFMQNFNKKNQQPILKTSSTWLVVFMTWSALALMLFLPVVAQWIIPIEYSASVKIIPWIITGFLFVGFYQFWVNIILYYKKTMVVPIVTIAAAVSNLALNLALIPIYGYIVAAINTAISYFILACLAGLIALKISSFTFDYFRWGKSIAVGGVLYLLALLVVGFTGKIYFFWVCIITILIYPFILWRVDFVSDDEKIYLQKITGVVFR